MSADEAVAADRPLRRDAKRNRDGLVAAAKAAFVTADTAVPLETIAKDAGVGIGTLYRHFPTRESLIHAVYAAELDEVTESAAGFLERLAPEAALRAWMRRYAEFVATKRGMLDTLRASWASGQVSAPSTRARITATIASILDAGARDGSLRGDIDADDVTAMLLAVLLSSPPDEPRSDRLLDLVMDALRVRSNPTV